MGLLEQIQTRLESGALRENLAPLFYDTLGWGAGKGSRRPVAVDGETLLLTPLAELGGLPVFHAEMPTGSKLPGIIYRRAVHKALTPTAQEHLLVYTTADQKQAQFVSARRVAGGKTELRTLPYTVGQPGRTTLERLAELAFAPTELGLYGDVPITQVMDRVTRAFDVEAVTKAFFREYRETFGAVEGMVRGVQGDRRLFTQRLFNRLMFIQFVARKGWLEFENSRDYLPALFAAAETKSENFYRDRLYWLLFSGLGMPHQTRQHEGEEKLQERRGKVPYLNGGLFEMVDADDVRGAVQIENDAFAAILELFSRHNFTIMESAPLDVMVAVDPEMLGKVFEELVTGRHETGSYYTPRPVVAFMCREALKGYLADALGSDSKTVQEAVAAFVDDDDPAGLPNPEAALSALKRVTVCDPACGSGAYLLGMMQELLRLRASLFAAKVKDHAALYARKLEIIERNLYGADKDPFAVNIAMLRLWLSLVVDDERDPLHDPTADVSLPNLKFKVCIGDSLTAPAPDLKGLSLQRDHYIADAEKLAALYDQYFLLAHDKQGRSKSDMETQIDEVQAEIADLCGTQAPDGAVNWQVCFAEVFAPKSPVRTMDGRFAFANEVAAQQTFVEEEADTGQSGFDVVVANPPYVRQELIKEQKPALKSVFPAVYSGTADLYCYFYARALQILKPGGMLSFISSNKWFRAGYGANLRKYIADTCRVQSITDFGELPVFESAATFPMIFIAQKGNPGGNPVFTQVKSLAEPYPDVLALIRQSGQPLPTDALRGSDWTLTDSASSDRLRKMDKAGISLGEYVNGQIYYGVKTGFNTAFVISGEKRAELIADDPKSAEIIKPLAVGDDVRRWHVESKDKWLIVTKIGVDIKRYPAIFAHLQQWQPELEKRYDKGEHWWELRACAYYDAFEKPKIIYPVIGKEPRFAFDTTGAFTNDKAFIIPINDLYLLGVLNSMSAWTYLKSVCSVIGDAEKGGRLELRAIYMEKLPIPTASNAEKAVVAALVECLLYLHSPEGKASNSETPTFGLMRDYFEQILNGLVHQLYFREEIQVFALLSRDDFPSLDGLPAQEKPRQLNRLFEKLYEDRHPLRGALFQLGSLGLKK